jgi:hypothetical protein
MACAEEVNEYDKEAMEQYDADLKSVSEEADPQLALAQKGKSVKWTDKYKLQSVRDLVSVMNTHSKHRNERFLCLDFPTMTAIDQKPWTRQCSDNLTAQTTLYAWRWRQEDFEGLESPFRHVRMEAVKHSAWGVLTPQQVATDIHMDADGAVTMLRAPRNGCKIIMIFKPKSVNNKTVEEAADVYERLHGAVRTDQYDEMRTLAHVGVVVLEPSGAV